MSADVCKLCHSAEDNVLELGEKMRDGDIVAHYFCLLLSSNLMQNGEDDEGICGFMGPDILKEVKRANSLACCYCKMSGASIGCCSKVCRRTFHLPCAIKKNCLFEFNKTFRSFCDRHHSIKILRQNRHKETDRCNICLDDMGPFHILNSIQSPCCNRNAWYHKQCLKQMAQSSGYFFRCPLCNDSKIFKEKIKLRGVFIPDRDASWEDGRYDEHDERPNRCDAIKCYCIIGRHFNSISEKAKYNLMFCKFCGSSCVHRYCNTMTVANDAVDFEHGHTIRLNKAMDYVCNACNEIVLHSKATSSIPLAASDTNSDYESIKTEDSNKIDSLLDSTYGSQRRSLSMNGSTDSGIFQSTLHDWCCQNKTDDHARTTTTILKNCTTQKDFSDSTKETTSGHSNHILKENIYPKQANIHNWLIFGQQNNTASIGNTNLSSNKSMDSLNALNLAAHNPKENESSTKNSGLLACNTSTINTESNPLGIKTENPPGNNMLKRWEIFSPSKHHLKNYFAFSEQSSSSKAEIKTETKSELILETKKKFLDLFARNVQFTTNSNKRKQSIKYKRMHRIRKDSANSYSTSQRTLSTKSKNHLISDQLTPTKKLLQTKITFFTTSPGKSTILQMPPPTSPLEDHTYSKSQLLNSTNSSNSSSQQQTKPKRHSNKKSKKSQISSSNASVSKRIKKNQKNQHIFLKKYAHLNLKTCSIMLDRIDVTKYKLYRATSIDNKVKKVQKGVSQDVSVKGTPK